MSLRNEVFYLARGRWLWERSPIDSERSRTKGGSQLWWGGHRKFVPNPILTSSEFYSPANRSRIRDKATLYCPRVQPLILAKGMKRHIDIKREPVVKIVGD